MQEVPKDAHNEHSGYERRDVNMKLILLISLTGVLFVVISVIVIDSVFISAKEEIIHETVLSPESSALRELRVREDEVLNSYKLLDSARGIYQIPVERAMDLVANEAYRTERQPSQ